MTQLTQRLFATSWISSQFQSRFVSFLYYYVRLQQYFRKHFNYRFYRPQRCWAKVMFLQVSVILSTEGGGCLPQCMLGYHPLQQTQPPRADTPGSRHHPPDQTPLEQTTTPPGSRPPPPTPGVNHPPAPDTHPLGSRYPPDHPPGSRPPRTTPPGADPTGPDPPNPPPLPPGSKRQHTVNERPVRILLECILVNNSFFYSCT